MNNNGIKYYITYFQRKFSTIQFLLCWLIVIVGVNIFYIIVWNSLIAKLSPSNRDIHNTKTTPTTGRKLARMMSRHVKHDLILIQKLYANMSTPSLEEELILDDFGYFQPEETLIRILTGYKANGFFVEVGGGNGSSSSQTLFLERKLHWKGLLVDIQPPQSQDDCLLEPRRRVWKVLSCVSDNDSSYFIFFKKPIQNDTGTNHFLPVRCYPLQTFLLALNITTVDYFSLDVEGHEVEVLETVPFDKLDITILSIEFSKARGGLQAIKTVMESNGYRIFTDFNSKVIFVKKLYKVQ